MSDIDNNIIFYWHIDKYFTSKIEVVCKFFLFLSNIILFLSFFTPLYLVLHSCDRKEWWFGPSNSFTSWVAVSFQRRPLLHAVNLLHLFSLQDPLQNGTS